MCRLLSEQTALIHYNFNSLEQYLFVNNALYKCCINKNKYIMISKM